MVELFVMYIVEPCVSPFLPVHQCMPTHYLPESVQCHSCMRLFFYSFCSICSKPRP